MAQDLKSYFFPTSAQLLLRGTTVVTESDPVLNSQWLTCQNSSTHSLRKQNKTVTELPDFTIGKLVFLRRKIREKTLGEMGYTDRGTLCSLHGCFYVRVLCTSLYSVFQWADIQQAKCLTDSDLLFKTKIILKRNTLEKKIYNRWQRWQKANTGGHVV